MKTPSSLLVALLAAAQAPWAAAAQSVDVTAFGAVPDDGLDDRAALVAALDAACAGGGGEVVFPPGTYDLAVPTNVPSGQPVVILPVGCGDLVLRGEPDGSSRLRVMDGQLPWESLLGSPGFGDDVSGLTLRHLHFDGNGTNNPVDGDDSVDDLFTERRHALRVYAGRRIVVEDCWFSDWRNVNVITLNGVDVGEVRVARCSFDRIGGAPVGAADWDHSTIYTDCDGALIEDCVFASLDGPGTFGVRAAIELHGPRQIARRNVIDGFTAGLNVTGISVLGSDLLLVEDNRVLNCSDGIRVWTRDLVNDPDGPSLERTLLRRNTITVDVDGWRVATDPFGQASTGISLEGGSDGALERVVVANNSIAFQPQTTERAWDRDSHGIAFSSFAAPDLAIDTLVLRDNTLERVPATALFLDATLTNVVVRGNTVIDAGSGPVTVPDGLRSFALVAGSYRDVVFARNAIIDRDARLGQAFQLFGDSLANNAISRTTITRSSPIVFVEAAPGLGAPWSVEAPVLP